MTHGKLTILIAAITLLVSLSGLAEAKDVAGKFGVGLDNTMSAATLGIGEVPSSPNSTNAPNLGISMKYWIDNDWAIAGVFGFIYASGRATTGNYDDDEGIWAFTLDLKGFYNFVKSDKANLAAFLTLHTQKESTTLKRPAGGFHSDFGLALAVGIAPEVFLTENFALCAELGLSIRVQEGVAFGISGDNLLGGFGFHYYF